MRLALLVVRCILVKVILGIIRVHFRLIMLCIKDVILLKFHPIIWLMEDPVEGLTRRLIILFIRLRRQ